jgi:UDP-2,4-diacetamido-2,4,6-trideoxy-beta-L-altropyranose hydrolase
MSWPVAFRVDADGAMGAGHLMRCLSLAHACKRQDGEPIFFTATTASGLLNRVRDAGFELVQIEPDAPDLGVRAVGVWASANKRSWAVLDGYQFEGAYQLTIAQAGARLMVIDDYVRLPRYHTQIMLDQNLGSEGRRYSTSPDCRVLLGPRYALLAPGYVEADVGGRTYPERASRLLITLGAADPANVTSLVLSALSDLDMAGVDVTVVIGGANERRDEVSRLAEANEFTVLEDATNMHELMADADIAITAAGTTSWEACRMGVPNITITVADNQRDIATALSDAGMAVGLGWHDDLSKDDVRAAVISLTEDHEERARMGHAGMELVDGRGAERVVDAMLEPTASQERA